MSDDLADAELSCRQAANNGGGPLATLLAEYDRRGRVEKAAAALVDASDKSTVQDMSLDEMHNLEDLLTALTDALNGGKP